ncbi:MAG: xanthine dehydrogenase family protein subunit M [Pseudolabrys sp.]
MKPARFDYVRADSVSEVHAVLAEQGDEARVIAGGQTLMPMLSMRLARPKVLVDIMHLPELQAIKADEQEIRIGAGVRQADIMAWPELGRTLPLLAAALPWVGHAQTRSRGTVCGSVAHADPAGEIPLVLVALGARIELSSRRRCRSLPADTFFSGMMSTARFSDEVIEAVALPARKPDTGAAFQEYGRRHGDFAIVACAAVASAAGIAFSVGGVADKPQRRDWPDLQGTALDDALDDFSWDLEARDDLHATASYRRALVRRMGKATIEEARRCRA